MEKGKLKKILAMCAMGIMATVMPFILTGCEKNNNSNSSEDCKSSVNITFNTQYGNLNFNNITLELSDGYAYLTDQNVPQITNEGDDKVFDFWATENGERFDFNSKIVDDIILHSVFTYDIEFVWEEEWDLYDSLFSYNCLYGGTCYIQESDGGWVNYSSFEDKQYYPIFKKIKKAECLADYITKEEYENLPKSTCFVTDCDTQKIVCESDVTTNTYKYYYFMFVEDSFYGTSAVMDYLPRGVSLIQFGKNKYAMNVLEKEYGSQVDYISGFSIGSSATNILYLTEEEFDLLTQTDFNDLLYGDNYNVDNDWQEDCYFVLQQITYFKFSCKLKNGEYKYFILKEDNTVGGFGLYKNISFDDYINYN